MNPRFCDVFEPKTPEEFRAQDIGERRAFQKKIGPILMNERDRWRGNRNWSRITEQLNSYRYWNYIAVDKIAGRCAQQTPHVSIRTKTTGRQFAQGYGAKTVQHLKTVYGFLQHSTDDLAPVAETHPLAELLLRVNPENTWGEFCGDTVRSLRLTGQFYWWLIPNSFRTETAPNGLPAELWLLPANWVSQEFWPNGEFKHWWVAPYGDESRGFDLPFEQVISGKYRNPADPSEAFAPTQAGAAWIDNVESIEKARRAGFANGVNPDLIIEMDAEHYADPSDTLLERIKERFQQRVSGVELRSGEPLISPPGTTVKPWSHTNKEMDFTESADQMRDNSLAIQGTPPVIAGVTADYTRATADAANVVFCDHVVNPTLAFIAGVATEKLAILYDPRIVIWFSDCTPANAEFELSQTEAHFRMGARTPNEIRTSAGMDAMADETYDSGYLPGGMAPLNESLQIEPEPIPETIPAGFPADDGGGDDEDDSED